MLDYLTSIERDGLAFIEVIDSADLDSPVPSCPGWRIRELALHQGSVHRWALACLAAGEPVDFVDLEVDDPGLAPWLRDGLDTLLAVLRRTDPLTPAWTFGPKPRTAGFWHRRQAHELAVHLWDARVAIGLAETIDQELARDGIDEVLTVFVPRQVRFERIAPLTDSISLELPDGTVFELGDGPYEAVVSGSASDLLLALWRRVPIGALTVTGNRQASERVLASALTP